jgi:hypothetical protein
MPNNQQNFRNSDRLTEWTTWILYGQAVISIISIAFNFLEYQSIMDFKNGVYPSQELALAAINASDSRQHYIAFFELASYIISAIFVLKWIHRANHNARQLGAECMAFTPGWAVGWYFIPILNIWKPYQAMKEIWKASSNPQSWNSQSVRVSLLLPLWWGLWIISNVFGNISFRMGVNAKTLNEFIDSNIARQFSEITFIPLCIVLSVIIRKIYEMQISHLDSDPARRSDEIQQNQ